MGHANFLMNRGALSNITQSNHSEPTIASVIRSVVWKIGDLRWIRTTVLWRDGNDGTWQGGLEGKGREGSTAPSGGYDTELCCLMESISLYKRWQLPTHDES